ncbi:MAG: VOC family protein [Planctomycetaceae bacterium]|nr:VOC family protein [Planctomycetaceae bacterium]
MQITEMRQGIPCWFELASTDPDKSAAFYHGLFGWQRFDMDLGPIGTYSFLNNANGCVGALCSMMPGPKSAGLPSTWGVYFAVDRCDDSTTRAVELGATIIAPPMDVNQHGRMSVLSDPTGAVFSLWQSTSSGGGPFVMFENHAVGWVELATRDTLKAREFYSKLLGWTYTESPIPVPDSGNYIEISVGGTRYGGILPMNPEWGEIPPHWGVYVMVPDVNACIAKAKELGGGNPLPAFDAPGVGRISMVSDPTGALCYVIALNTP